jgi:phage-related protein
MKDVRFVDSSLDDLKKFPAGARREAGFELLMFSLVCSRATGSL